MKYVSEEKKQTIIKRVSHYGSPCIYNVYLVQAKMIKIKFFHLGNLPLKILTEFIVVLVKLLRHIFSPALRIKFRIHIFPN